MPRPGKQWFHVTFVTHGAWLPGDPRGFRAKHHKLHSSGNHRHPPPSGEHAGLHEFSKRLSPDAVRIPKPLLEMAGEAIVAHAGQLGLRLNAVSVAPMHVHLLIELPRKGAGAEVGRIKRRVSWAVRNELPGKVWAKGCGMKPIRDKAHLSNTYHYVLRHAEQGAWVWSVGEGVI